MSRATLAFRRGLWVPSAPSSAPPGFVYKFISNWGSGSGEQYIPTSTAPPPNRFPDSVQVGDVGILLGIHRGNGDFSLISTGWTELGTLINTTQAETHSQPKVRFWTKVLTAGDITNGIRCYGTNITAAILNVWQDIQPVVFSDISKINYNSIATAPPVPDPSGLNSGDRIMRWWATAQQGGSEWGDGHASGAFGSGNGSNKQDGGAWSNAFCDSGSYDAAPGETGLSSFVQPHTSSTGPNGMRGAIILRAV